MRKVGGEFVISATDLANHLACRHLTNLNYRAANGEIEKPFRHDEMLDTLIERGLEHEKGYVEFLRTSGKSIVEIREFGGEKASQETVAAMQQGIDVVVQGSLQFDGWSGRPDLLLRVDTPSDLGEWSYEVADTKLSQDTRVGTILQLCLYSDMVATMQGVMPHRMSVVKPGEPFDVENFYTGISSPARLFSTRGQVCLVGVLPSVGTGTRRTAVGKEGCLRSAVCKSDSWSPAREDSYAPLSLSGSGRSTEKWQQSCQCDW